LSGRRPSRRSVRVQTASRR